MSSVFGWLGNIQVNLKKLEYREKVLFFFFFYIQKVKLMYILDSLRVK